MSEQLLQQILEELKELKVGQQRLEAEQQSMKAGQQRLEAEQQSMKADIADIKQYTSLIPLIQRAVSELHEEAAATSESVQRIQDTLRGHEVTLDLLSRRSIDQEAALKRIK